MQVGSIEEYLKVFDEPCNAKEWQADQLEFPHVVVVECDIPEFSVAWRWCWTNFGPKHGECSLHSEYPACPLVLATEHLKVVDAFNKKYEFKAYRYDQVAAHCHKGVWTAEFLGKTEYDHGFSEFCFAVEDHKQRFLQHIPSIDWGENYPWLRDGTIL